MSAFNHNNKGRMMLRLLFIAATALSLQGCAGLIIGAATDATIAVAKVPFKVGGAVLDVVTGDDEED